MLYLNNKLIKHQKIYQILEFFIWTSITRKCEFDAIGNVYFIKFTEKFNDSLGLLVIIISVKFTHTHTHIMH